MAEATLRNRWYSLLFGVRRSIRYHMQRVRFFDGLNTCATALSLLFGSAMILAILGAGSQ